MKDGLRSSEGPILMPDGTTLFTEPGASKVHKIDKNGAISTFVENTEPRKRPRARFEGTPHRDDGADSIDVLHPPAAKTVLAKMSTRPNDLVIDKKDGIYFTLPSDKPSAVYYIPAGGQATKVGEAARRAWHPAEPGREDAVLRGFRRRIPHRVRRAAGRQTDEQAQLRQVPGPADNAESHADGIAVDSQGRVYVGIATGVQVFSAKGEALGVIPTSQRPQNLAFAGPDKKTLYLTGGSALFSVKMLAQGYAGRAEITEASTPGVHGI